MIEIVLFVWILLFLIFFVAGIVTDNPIFGLVAGFILVTLALGIIVDGLQFQDGMSINASGNYTNITQTYTTIAPPFSTWGILFGLTLLVISIYLFYANAMEL